MGVGGMKQRYLTKSRFKLAQECPAKLFYTGKKEYPDQKQEDSFLAALADGGFQVGALAKCYYPGGVEVESLDDEQALAETNELLKRDKVVIFEAAVKYQNLFCRVDILVKDGTHLELIEVKAKSFNSSEGPDGFLNKNGTNNESKWGPYLEDAAFQKYVLDRAFPSYSVAPYLMLADKDSVCPVDGLNQKFKLFGTNGRRGVKISPKETQQDIEKKILCKIPVNEMCEMIYAKNYGTKDKPLTFGEMVARYADYYERDEKIDVPVSGACKGCEFRATAEQKAAGLKSGYEECWREKCGWTQADFEEPNIFDIWFLHYRTRDKWLGDGILKISQINPSDFSAAPMDEEYSTKGRQLLQITKTQQKDTSPWVDKRGLAAEMRSWRYPLHMIDFETAMPAIPFNKGLRPYEGIAFQFSHHVIDEDGSVEHRGEYINSEPGKYPNFDFIRALKKELEGDNGSIFRYSHHENTYLCHIYEQLTYAGAGEPDSRELREFIKSITKAKNESPEQWQGPRNMIDLCELVKHYYYDPYMKGSNSIKVVLPAILNSSQYLQRKYSAPVYGAVGGIKSFNYKDWRWIEFEPDGSVRDPYLLLPKLFDDLSPEEFELLEKGELFSTSEELHDGAAAMTAYAKLQFTEMTELERRKIIEALLKYCELDTLAMVMIVEGWREMVR